MIRIFSLSIVLLSFSSFATELPALPSQTHDSPHKLFLSSESDQQGFDTWKIDGGYSYNVFDKIDLYVGARVNKSDFINETGFLSGVSYQISPRVSVKSTLHSYHEEKTVEQGKESVIAAEVSSRMRLTENIDIHATLDYQEWQQGLEVGLGFRF